MKLKRSHPFLNSSNDIVDICAPLRSLGINYFSYVRNYDDGSRLYLCTSPGALEHHLESKLFLHGPCEAKPSTYQKQIVLWRSQEKQWVYEWVHQHHIGNGIVFISPHEDYCEFFTYAGDYANQHLVDVYFNNLDYLKNFSEYFLSVMQDKMVNVFEKNKIILPGYSQPIPKIPSIEVIGSNLHSIDPFSEIKLSAREKQCALYLLQGKTQKETARILSLSPRTVEAYLKNLKIKMDCRNKSSLILKLAKGSFYEKI